MNEDLNWREIGVVVFLVLLGVFVGAAGWASLVRWGVI